MAEKLVYHFREGNKDMKALLGGKGANLAEMTGIGLPVPPGFTDHHRGLQPLLGQRLPTPTGSRRRSTRPWRSSRPTPARSSATPATRCCCRCAPALAPRCRA